MRNLEMQGGDRQKSIGPLSFVLRLAALLLVAGCGPKEPATGEVSGIVTVEGLPVGGLIVHFEPQDGVRLGLPPAYGVTNESGRYRAMLRGKRPGAAVGLNHVRITPVERDGAPPAEIHARYGGDYTFWYEVAPGANTFDIELKADPLKKVPAR